MIPEYEPIEKGIVIREVINPKHISKFPEGDRRYMHLRYTVKQMIREGYTDMSFVCFNTVIKYELVPEEGFDNLYDAYKDWWKSSIGYIVHNVHMAINPSLLDPSIIFLLENKKAMDETESEGILFQKDFGRMFINYSRVRGKGRPNLWQAYRDWWDKNEKLTSGWNGEVAVPEPSSCKSMPFYPINPIEEKENTMQFKISRNQISNQIKKIEESLKNQKTRIISELNSIEEKISNGEPISGNLKEYHMYDLILRQLNYLKSFENVVEIICSEEEKDKIFKEIPCSSDEE